MAYISKWEQIPLQIKTVFLFLSGNASRCHKNHVELTTDQQGILFVYEDRTEGMFPSDC
jgi:hypothetical protein